MRGRGLLALGMLAAATASVALLAGTPLYTDGVLQRLLTRDLERHQERTGTYPGAATVSVDLYRLRDRVPRHPLVQRVTEELDSRLVPALRMPVSVQMRQLRMDYLYDERPVARSVRQLAQASDAGVVMQKVFGRVDALDQIADHVEISHGRMFATEPAGGAYEVIVSDQAFRDMQLALGATYQLVDLWHAVPRVAVRVVGVFKMSDPRDLYWFGRFRDLAASYVVDFSLFERDFLAAEVRNLTRSSWRYAFDYHQLSISNVGNVLARYQDYVRLASASGLQVEFPIARLLEAYEARALTLRRTLLFLQAPSAFLLLILITMLAQLVVDSDRAEIATLKSRGAPSAQLSVGYLLEAAILTASGFLLGIPLALLIVRIVGASNGFLEFVARPALPVVMSSRIYLFAAVGAGAFMVAILMPLARATRTSIVGFKSRLARPPGSPWWQRYYLDLGLLAIAAYALFSFRQRREIQELAPELVPPLDSLLFLAAIIFVVGASLLLIRAFPALVAAGFALGRKLWSPATYAAFLHVSRSRSKEHFLMTFLALTLGIGLYSSTVARTINQNTDAEIVYQVGADVVLRPEFVSESTAGGDTVGPGDVDATGQPSSRADDDASARYIAPPLEPFTALPGVAGATRVFRRSAVQMVLASRQRIRAQVMALVPHEFGRISTLRPDLLLVHWFHYLNLLAGDPKAALVSTSAQKVHDVRLGDTLLLSWRGQRPVDVVVRGFIDFWPTFDPQADRTGDDAPVLAVTNFEYVFAKMATEPHEIWLEVADQVASSTLYTAMAGQRLPLLEVRDANQLQIAARNDPLLQGTNGVLTFGFITSVVVTITGYVLFWVFALRARTLQFGLLRAMGVSRRRVVGMLVVEQLLLSGYATVVGVAIGQLAALLFVPLVQLAATGAAQVLPFQVVALRSDYLRFYALVVLLLFAGAAMFQLLVRRVRVHEALKLGEE